MVKERHERNICRCEFTQPPGPVVVERGSLREHLHYRKVKLGVGRDARMNLVISVAAEMSAGMRMRARLRALVGGDNCWSNSYSLHDEFRDVGLCLSL